MRMPHDFDNWLTTPPDLDAYPTGCDTCGKHYPAGDHLDGDDCPECDEGVLCELYADDPHDEPDYWA